MKKFSLTMPAAAILLLIVALVAGCGGGSGAQRPSGLAPDAVVKSFYDAAKADKVKEAALYVSPDSVNNAKVVIKYVTGQAAISELKNSNLLSVRKVAQQGDYAVVVATLQQQADSLKINVKPVGLMRINDEWYIVDNDQIFQDAKFKVLQQLMTNI
jgi:hypothetical protein